MKQVNVSLLFLLFRVFMKKSLACKVAIVVITAGLLQFVLLTVFCFNWSVKKHCLKKILVAV